MIDDIARPDPRRVERTGDDTPAASLARFIRRMSGWHQAVAVALALAVTGLALVPLELQRMIFDDALAEGDADLLWRLTGAYAAVIVVHQGAKFSLSLFQGWIGESTILHLRRHLWSIDRRTAAFAQDRERPIVSILTIEVEKLGGFVGHGPSQFAANGSMLVGTLGYLLVIEPVIALLGALFIAPQAVLAPLLQARLNRLVEHRLKLMRRYGTLLGRTEGRGGRVLTARKIYSNRMRFFMVKFMMKALLNLLNAAAPLGVMAVGGWMAISGETTVGAIVAAVTGLARLGDPVRALVGFYREAAQAKVHHDMIAAWMHARLAAEAR